MALLKVAETAARAELRAHEQALQESARLLEGTSQRFVAERDALLERLTQSRRQTTADMEAYVAAVNDVSRRWAFGVKMPGRKRSGAVQRHEDLSGTLKTGSMDVNRALYSRVQSCRRRKHSDPFWNDACDRIGRIHYPGVKRPLAQDARWQARYDTRALLAAMNSTRKAAILRSLEEGQTKIDSLEAQGGRHAERNYGQRQGVHGVQALGEGERRVYICKLLTERGA